MWFYHEHFKVCSLHLTLATIHTMEFWNDDLVVESLTEAKEKMLKMHMIWCILFFMLLVVSPWYPQLPTASFADCIYRDVSLTGNLESFSSYLPVSSTDQLKNHDCQPSVLLLEFRTWLLHPNSINSNGSICVAVLKELHNSS